MNLEEQSFANMTFFYFDELNQVIGGVNAIKVFPDASRRTVRKRGLIETYYAARGCPNSRVTDEACNALGEWAKMFKEDNC